jgi:hypothetical protein
VNGQELPIIDVTNPAFSPAPPSETEMATFVQKSAAEQERFNRMPAFMRKPILWLMSRQSVLMRGLMGADGTFLSAMNTYLMKLGPDNLGQGFSQMDRALVSSIPAMSLRLRLKELVRLMADAVAPVLTAQPGRPFDLINIAGGPCMDSINLLLLLYRDRSNILSGRSIRIHALDLESPGPVFGSRALQALQAPGAPLEGLQITMEYTPYQWAESQRLQTYLEKMNLRESVVTAASEGGLFDYGTDAEICGHLRILHAMTPDQAVVAATTTPIDGPGRAFNQTSGARTISRPREAFAELAAKAGWKISGFAKVFMNDVLVLEKNQGTAREYGFRPLEMTVRYTSETCSRVKRSGLLSHRVVRPVMIEDTAVAYSSARAGFSMPDDNGLKRFSMI